jgi:hypothetical protein
MMNAVILQLSVIHHRYLEPVCFLLQIMFGVDVFVRVLCLIDLRLPRNSELKVRVGEHENCKFVLFKHTFIF